MYAKYAPVYVDRLFLVFHLNIALKIAVETCGIVLKPTSDVLDMRNFDFLQVVVYHFNII